MKHIWEFFKIKLYASNSIFECQMEKTSVEWETKENILARLRHIRRKLLALLVMRSLENIFSMYRRFTLLDGSHKWQMPIFFFFPQGFSSLTRCSVVKQKHTTWFSLNFFLYSSVRFWLFPLMWGQFCQSLDVLPALQRTCLVEIFVPCVYSDSLGHETDQDQVRTKEWFRPYA